MDRGIPVSSKLISKKINEKNMQIHLAKLQNIKSSISREPPQSFSHLKSNKKKVQVYEAKLTEIERENRLLLEKLTTIMKTQNSVSTSHQQQRPTPKSLNRDYRKRELVKITIENQAFLRRLQDLKPTYNRQLWENDRKVHELYIKNISEYGGAPVSFIKSPQPGEERPQTYQNGRDNSFLSNGNENKAKFNITTKKSNTQFQPVKKNISAKLDPVSQANQKKTILHQTKRKIGFSQYMIHIYSHNNTFNIIASNNNSSDFKTLSISKKEGDELKKRFGDSYEELANSIKFKGNKIVFDHNNYTENEIAEAHDENDTNDVKIYDDDGKSEEREEENSQKKPSLTESQRLEISDYNQASHKKREDEEAAENNKEDSGENPKQKIFVQNELRMEEREKDEYDSSPKENDYENEEASPQNYSKEKTPENKESSYEKSYEKKEEDELVNPKESEKGNEESNNDQIAVEDEAKDYENEVIGKKNEKEEGKVESEIASDKENNYEENFEDSKN